MTWIDNIVVGIIIAGGLFIFYKALKDPVDAFFRLIGRGIGSLKDKLVNTKDAGGEYYSEIRYG